MRRFIPLLTAVALAAAACASTKKSEPKTIIGQPEPGYTPPAASSVTPTPAATATTPFVSDLSREFARACAQRNAAPTPAARPIATPAPGANLIAVFPRDLLLPENAVPNADEVKDGSAATAQWNRSWTRKAGTDGSATDIKLQAALYLTISEAFEDFNQTASGAGAITTITGLIELRGARKDEICITPIDIGQTGADQQSAYRAEYLRGSERYVTYWVWLRVRNVRALLQTFAAIPDGKEAPALLDETKRLAKAEADLLTTTPATQPPAQ